MNIYQIEYTQENKELALPYGHIDTYYDKDGKMAYGLKVFRDTMRLSVIAISEDAVRFNYVVF